MKSLGQYTEEQINEELFLTLTAIAAVSFCVAPLLNTQFAKSVGEGIGGLLSGIGAAIGKKKDKKDEKEKKNRNDKDDDDKPSWVPRSSGSPTPTPPPSPKGQEPSDADKQANAFQYLLQTAEDKLSDVKDPYEAEKLKNTINNIRAASVDDNGNFLKPEEIKKNLSDEQMKEIEQINKDHPTLPKDFKKILNQIKNKIKKDPKKADDDLSNGKKKSKNQHNKHKENKPEEYEGTNPETGKKGKFLLHKGERGAKYGQWSGSDNKIYGQQLKDLLKSLKKKNKPKAKKPQPKK